MNSLFQKFLIFDLTTTERLRFNQKQKTIWFFAAFLAHSGDSWFWLAALGLVWLLGNKQWHTLSAIFAIGTFFLAIFVLLLKFSIRRKRPEGEWGEIYRNTDPHSFPSGHATRAFFLATLAWSIGPVWFAVLLTIWAPLVSVARVATGVHYLSDILAGMFIGIIVAGIYLWIIPPMMQMVPFLF